MREGNPSVLAKISNERSLPIILYANNVQTWLYIADAMTFCIMSLLLKPTYWLGFLFFGLCAAVLFREVRQSKIWLRLDYAGFTVGSRDREFQVPWHRVAEFVVVRSPQGKKVVGWCYLPPDDLRAHLLKRDRTHTTVDSTLPDTYGISAAKLAALMSELHRCYHLTERYLASCTSD
jgi:hypothetical protein